MASGVLRLSDVIVPAIFNPMVMRRSIERTALITSGAAVVDPLLNANLQGAGVTWIMPRMNSIDTGDIENVSSDDPTVFSTPNKPSMNTEIAVRLSRNQSWSQMDLARSILAADPLAALADQVGDYWAKRRQRILIAQLAGIFANNATASDSFHTQNDMTVNLSTLNGGTYAKGVTDFNGRAFIDALITMGDALDGIALIAMHSIVYATALKNNLIQFRLDAEAAVQIPTYMGKDVVFDDGMPTPASGVFETWLFGRSCIGIGTAEPDVPSEVARIPGSGNGGGQEVLWSRIEMAHHIPGTSYIGAPAAGGPSNAATTGNLAAATSWQRVAPNRKYVPIARLVSREY